jgi:hypothetical protein
MYFHVLLAGISLVDAGIVVLLLATLTFVTLMVRALQPSHEYLTTVMFSRAVSQHRADSLQRAMKQFAHATPAYKKRSPDVL